jgi:hypothetical protein
MIDSNFEIHADTKVLIYFKREASKQTTMTEPKPPAIAWDPTTPFSLSFCPSSAAANTAATTNESAAAAAAPLSILLSHDGTGIHPDETTCLLSLLDARDAAHQQHDPPHEQSVQYRRCLCECLMSLKSNVVAESSDVTSSSITVDNYESLALIYAMMHLSEIYLLPPSSSSSSSSSSSNDKLSGAAGSLTADTIRYLRTHHVMYDPSSLEIQQLLKQDQPEYYIPSTPPSDPILHGPFHEPYYNLVLHLMNLGQLNHVWGVLSRHSSCVRAEMEAMKKDGELSKETEGWSVLRALLLSAPLPGGRGDEDDSGLIENDDLDTMNEDDVLYANDRLMQNVSRSSYCLWEAQPKNANRLRNDRIRSACLKGGYDPPSSEDVEMLPDRYSENIAMNAFSTWQRTVKSHFLVERRPRYMDSNNSDGSSNACTALFSRFPQLRQICHVLLGQFSFLGGDCWAEMLIAELLYVRPNIHPEDIAIRAREHMRRCGVLGRSQEGMILKVMEGNGEEVVNSMFAFGGGSGAALPATLVSV